MKNRMGRVVGWAFLTAATAHAAGPAATVLRFRGAVQYRQAAADAWAQVGQTNLTLNVGAELSTKANAEAVLKLGAASIVTVRELTLMRITAVAGEDTTLGLVAGRLFLHVKKGENTSFKVATPAAIAGVRGTIFVTESDAQKNTRVTVTDGSVDVTGQVAGSRTVTCPKGNSVVVVFNQQPQDPRPAEMKLLEEMKGFRENLQDLTMLGGGAGAAATQIAEENMKQLQDAGKQLEAQRQQRLGAAKARVDLPTLKEAFTRCVADTGYVPQQDDRKFDEKTSQLVLMLVEGKQSDGQPIPGWKGPYVEGNLKDPFGRFYKLRYKENAKGEGRFEIYSLGRDVVKMDDDPVPTMIRLDKLAGPGGKLPVRAAK